MRASSISVVPSTTRPPILHRVIARAQRSQSEAALTKFASDLSPAKGQKFFDLLVEYVADCLGFETVIVGELASASAGAARFIRIAEYPVPASEATRAVIGTRCDLLAATDGSIGHDVIEGGRIDVPLVGCDGRAIGVICGFGHGAQLDPSTMRTLLRIIAHRAGSRARAAARSA